MKKKTTPTPKVDIELKPIHSEIIALCYSNIISGRGYARHLSTDKDLPKIIQQDFLSVAVSLYSPINRIESRIPACNKERFKEQLTDADSLRLDNMKRMYTHMTPDKQDLAEMAMQAILDDKLIFEAA